MHIGIGDAFAHIERTAALAGPALAAHITPVFIAFVLVKALGRRHGEVAVLDACRDLVFFETGQVNVQLVGVIRLANICAHHGRGVLAVQFMVCLALEHAERLGKETIEQIFTKNARQHTSFLHSRCRRCGTL